MKHLSVVLILVCALVLPSTGISQTLGAQKKGKAPTGVPSPDSIRALMRALDRKDTTALKRYGLVPGGLPKSGNPREANLAVMTRASQDSIVLRWAPSKPGGWIEANRYGYVIERVTMTKDGKTATGTAKTLTVAPLKPWSLDEWKQRAPRDNRFAAVAAQALYGKSFSPSSDAPPGVAMRAGVEELEGRYGFALFAADMDPLVADGLALRYVDRDVKPGAQYVYRLHLAIRDTSYHLDTAYAVGSLGRQELPPPPPNLTAEGFDRHITLRWENFPPGLGYSAFHVYRSEDGGKTYKRLNDNPVVTPYREGAREKQMPNYTDTTAVNYRTYRYQIRGITPFAELSKPAEIEASATDKTPPARPVIEKPEQISRHAVRVTWQMPDTSKDLAGFVVSRSPENLQGYVPITVVIPKGKGSAMQMRDIMRQLLPVSSRSYVDTNATSAEPYYMVGAVDTAGNLSQSLPAYAAIIDSVPPRMPKGLAGRIDTNGIVHLHWNLGPEPNIIGYRVLWANDPRHEFTMRTPRPVKDTVFADTINLRTLTHMIYYRIAAVNDRFIPSPVSPILALRRPDVVPPGSPQFTKVSVSDSSVMLVWATSPSDDVRKQILYRRPRGDTGWVLLASLQPRDNSYTDRAVKRRVMYEYSLEAIDSSGLRSIPAVPVQGRPYDNGERPGVTNLAANFDVKGKLVRVSWGYKPPAKERYWFVVYRSYGAGGLTQYKAVEGKATVFNDKDLVGKGTYRYAVRVQTAAGGISSLSEPATVQVK